MIRVLLYVQAALARDCLAESLRATPGLEVVSCPSVTECAETLRCSACVTDVILLNHLDAEVTNGLVAIAGMSGFKGRLMILAHDSYGSAAAFPGDGASRYSVFPTERRFAELVTAIKTACPSRPAPPPSEEMAPESSLSRQEQRAAELVAEGLANKEIGARMGISESAVKALLQRIFLKMRVRSRGQVIRMLVERSCRVH